MMKRIMSLVTVLILALSIFAGCNAGVGGDKSGGGSVGSANTTEAVKDNSYGPKVFPGGVRLGMSEEQVEKCLGKSLTDAQEGDNGGTIYTLSADVSTINAWYETEYMQSPTYLLSFDSDGELNHAIIVSKYIDENGWKNNFTKAGVDYFKVKKVIDDEMGEGTTDDSLSDLNSTWEKDGVSVTLMTTTSTSGGYSGVNILVSKK